MTPAQVAHIMLLVDALRDADDEQAAGSVIHARRAAVEAALSDAPQAGGWVMVPVEPTQTMMQQGKHALYEESMGDFDASLLEIKATYRAMLSARPSAPTAVEPPELSMSMFASVADFEAAKRRAAVEPDERAEFEAWAGPITALAKENGKYVEVMTSLAWEAWQARASKGTPL